jgi:hypothetical protein
LSGSGSRKFEKKYFFAVFNVLGHSEYFCFFGGKKSSKILKIIKNIKKT